VVKRPLSTTSTIWSGCHAAGQAVEVDEMAWMRQLLDWQREAADPGELLESLRYDLAAKEIFMALGHQRVSARHLVSRLMAMLSASGEIEDNPVEPRMIRHAEPRRTAGVPLSRCSPRPAR
jgi:hypothetical protein